MVLQISPYARQVRNSLDSKAGELGLIADAGEHQNLGRLNGPGRKHDLAGCLNRADLAAPVELNARDHSAFERELPDQGTCQDGEIGLVHDGIEIVGRYIQSPSAANTNVRQSGAAGALLEDSVLVRKDGNAQRLRSRKERRCQWIGV